MPYPQNVETAKAVENIIREQGAIPATIALLDGKVHIGKSVYIYWCIIVWYEHLLSRFDWWDAGAPR